MPVGPVPASCLPGPGPDGPDQTAQAWRQSCWASVAKIAVFVNACIDDSDDDCRTSWCPLPLCPAPGFPTPASGRVSTKDTGLPCSVLRTFTTGRMWFFKIEQTGPPDDGPAWPGLAGTRGGAGLRPAPRAPGQNQRPALPGGISAPRPAPRSTPDATACPADPPYLFCQERLTLRLV